MPYTLPPGRSVLLTDLKRRTVVQVLMRPDRVVDMGPGLELGALLAQRWLHRPDFVECFPVRPLRPLDVTLEFRAPGRDHKERQAPRRTR
ncbi:MAG TPA: hypothetical protein VNL96_11530, partial [Gemmatimonadaceae bacterium]|nr:hypothetical protein [Gemmatimonadaceae bacterium]